MWLPDYADCVKYQRKMPSKLLNPVTMDNSRCDREGKKQSLGVTW